MKVTLILRAAVIAWAVLALPASAWGASAKDVFTKVAPSVVVVLALDEQGKTTGQGSGVVVGDYEVVTNCHVLRKAADVAVRQAADWSVRETYRMAANLLARNDERDLCLLFVDELPERPAAQAVRLGAAKVLSVGEEVYAVGAPAGLELSLSRGVVSQLRGAFGKRSAPLVQTDAAISPGSSGGGLFNQSGELVGITTFKWRGESLNFALPAEWVEELRAQGRSQFMEARRRIECPKNPNYECVMNLALQEANSIKSPAYRCDRLLDIAATQTRVGDTGGAKKTLSAAFEAAREIRRLTSFDELAKIAVAQTKTGDDQATRRTLSAFRDEIADLSSSVSNRVLREYATALAKTGNFAKALEITHSIIDNSNDDLLYRARALSDIAEAQAEAGDVANAMKTAMSIDDHQRDGDYYRKVALAGIAAAQAKADDFAGSIKTAMSSDNARFRREVLSLTAMWQLAKGHVEAAEQTLALVSSPNESTRMLLCIIQAKKGNFAAALAIADSFDSREQFGAHVSLLSEVAVFQTRAGDAQGAKRTLEAALETVHGIDKASWSAWGLSNAAAAQAKAGGPKAAAQTFAEALRIARSIGDDLFGIVTDKYHAMTPQGKVYQVEIPQNPTRADFEAVADVINSPQGKNYELAVMPFRDETVLDGLTLEDLNKPGKDIAKQQAEAGFFADAVKTALNIDADKKRHRIQTLLLVAHHLSGRPPLPWWDPRRHF